MLVVINSKHFEECSEQVRITLKNRKKGNNLLMIYHRSSEIPLKIRTMHINFDYFYLEETGYIMNKQNICFATSPSLEKAIKCVQRFKNVEESRICRLDNDEVVSNEELLEFVKKLTY